MSPTVRPVLAPLAAATVLATVLTTVLATVLTTVLATVLGAGAAQAAPAKPAPITSVRILPDLNGDGVPEVLIRRSTREELRDGRNGGVITQVPGGSVVAAALVGSAHTPGVTVTTGASSVGGSLIVSAYDGKGHTVWKHPLAGVPVRTGDSADDRLIEVFSGPFDGDLTTDVMVEQRSTSELRLTVADAATGAVHHIADLPSGDLVQPVTLTAGREGVLVTTAPTKTVAGTMRVLDGGGTQVWQSSLGLGASADIVLDAEPFTTAPMELLSEGLAAAPGRSAGLYTRLVDTRSGHVLWTEPGLAGGSVVAGGGRGAYAVLANQKGSSVTVTAVEASGAKRWSRTTSVSFGAEGLPEAYSLGSIGGNAVPDVIVYLAPVQNPQQVDLKTLVLDGATGRSLPAPKLGIVPDLTPGVVTATSVAPGDKLGELGAATDNKGITKVSRHDLHAPRDRWSTLVGQPGRVALAVFGRRGPRGCGSVGVLLGGGQTIDSVVILGMTNGDVRWTLDALTGKFTKGKKSSHAC